MKGLGWPPAPIVAKGEDVDALAVCVGGAPNESSGSASLASSTVGVAFAAVAVCAPDPVVDEAVGAGAVVDDMEGWRLIRGDVGADVFFAIFFVHR